MSQVEFDEKTLKIASEKVRMEILKILNDKKVVSINELAEIIGKHRSTINRHLLKLAEVDLVERTEIAKGSFVYSLSPKGLALVEHVEKYGIMPKIKVRVLKERKLRKVLSFLSKLIVYGIPLIFLLVGIGGLVVNVEVKFLSRIIWFLMFAAVSVITFKIFKKFFSKC